MVIEVVRSTVQLPIPDMSTFVFFDGSVFNPKFRPSFSFSRPFYHHGIKVAYMSPEFLALRTIERPMPATVLAGFPLPQSAADTEIIPRLGAGYQVKLIQVIGVVQRQGNGEPGKLVTNGLSNIFYIEGTRKSAAVHCNSFGWHFHAYPVDNMPWIAGTQVFFPQRRSH